MLTYAIDGKPPLQFNPEFWPGGTINGVYDDGPDGYYIDGFGRKLRKSFKKATKSVQKATKSVAKAASKAGKQAGKHLKAVAPYALQAGAAYFTGGLGMAASTLGGGLLQRSGNPILDAAGNAAGGGMTGFIAQGGSNSFDWQSLLNRGIDYLQSGGGEQGYSLSGTVQALRGSVSSGYLPGDGNDNAPPPPPTPRPASANGDMTPLLIAGGVGVLALVLLLRK